MWCLFLIPSAVDKLERARGSHFVAHGVVGCGGEITSGEHAGDRYSLNMQGVDARHMGVEMNFTYRPVKWFELEGMLSVGDWVWDSNAKGYFYNQNGEPLKDLRGS